MTYIEKLFGLHEKVAIVTGGTGVLGAVMCEALAGAGAKVVVIGRRIDAADHVAKRINANGGEALAVRADVMNEEMLREAKKKILERFGTIDILVNAAGGNLPGAVIPPDKTFLDLRLADFTKVVDLNLGGSVLPSQVFGEVMMSKRKGAIVNISSLSASLPLTRVAGYSAAKAAISNFTQWLSVEMATKFGEGIRVNAIAPGFFLTEQNRTLLTNDDGSLSDRGRAIISGTPFGRFGRPEELSGALLWLCSEASGFVSGIVVPVDGAFSAFSGV